MQSADWLSCPDEALIPGWQELRPWLFDLEETNHPKTQFLFETQRPSHSLWQPWISVMLVIIPIKEGEMSGDSKHKGILILVEILSRGHCCVWCMGRGLQAPIMSQPEQTLYLCHYLMGRGEAANCLHPVHWQSTSAAAHFKLLPLF